MDTNPYQPVLPDALRRPVSIRASVAFAMIPIAFVLATAGLIYCTANQILPPAKISWFLGIALVWMTYGVAGTAFSAMRFRAIGARVLGCLWSAGWAIVGVLFSGFCIIQINATI